MTGVTIVEVGPRDGLQNEPGFVPTATKLALIERLAECGFRRIEATAFVSPDWVPQMADHETVMRGVRPREGLRYAALVPNLRGAETALSAGAQELSIFTAASETFSRRNTNCSIEESLQRLEAVAKLGLARGVPVRGYVSCVTDCPYEGEIAPARVVGIARRLLDIGCYEVALGETLGNAMPAKVAALLDAVCADIEPAMLAGHFHDTGGQALGNIEIGYAHGLRVFDAAVGGLGGCPYALGAKGNVATESVLRYFSRRGIETGIDIEKLVAVGRMVEGLRGD